MYTDVIVSDAACAGFETIFMILLLEILLSDRCIWYNE